MSSQLLRFAQRIDLSVTTSWVFPPPGARLFYFFNYTRSQTFFKKRKIQKIRKVPSLASLTHISFTAFVPVCHTRVRARVCVVVCTYRLFQSVVCQLVLLLPASFSPGAFVSLAYLDLTLSLTLARPRFIWKLGPWELAHLESCDLPTTSGNDNENKNQEQEPSRSSFSSSSSTSSSLSFPILDHKASKSSPQPDWICACRRGRAATFFLHQLSRPASSAHYDYSSSCRPPIRSYLCHFLSEACVEHRSYILYLSTRLPRYPLHHP